MPRKKATKRPVLSYHKASGQYCKRRKGKVYYFGADETEALKRFAVEWPNILEGQTRRRKDSIDLHSLANAFLAEKRSRVDAGEMTSGSWSEYHRCCESILLEFGKQRDVTDLQPDDFGKLRAKLAKRYGPSSLRKYITLTRALFAFAFENGYIEVPVRYGTSFEVPPKKAIRLARHAKGSRLLEASECRALLAAADAQLRAMILLGLNCGYGQTDCANLTRSMLRVRSGWLEGLRPKTAIQRRAPLWPETLAALDAVAQVRPEASCDANEDCVFLTVGGLRWVRYHDRGEDQRGSSSDDVAVWFKRLTSRLGITGTFYDLRHTFRTIADEVLDRVAIDLVMGHADHSMGAEYRERVGDERLQKVVDHVRAWLFKDTP